MSVRGRWKKNVHEHSSVFVDSGVTQLAWQLRQLGGACVGLQYKHFVLYSCIESLALV